MEVSESVAKWLEQLNVLKEGASETSDSVWFISESDTQKFESGLGFVPLLKRLHKSVNSREPTPFPEINSLKNTTSSAARLYNWNILIKVMEMVGIEIDSDMKALIVAGDRGMVVEVIRLIYQAESTMTEPSVESTELKPPKRRKNKLNQEGALLLENVETNIHLFQTENCLEFLIVSFCKYFKIQPKQAAGLLADSGNYLSQLIIRGLKGSYEPILEWLEGIQDNAEHLSMLVANEAESGSINLVFSSLKSGLSSKDWRIVAGTCEVMSSLHRNLLNYHEVLFEWFLNKAFSPLVKSWETHSFAVVKGFVEVMMEFGGERMSELIGEVFCEYYLQVSSYFNNVMKILPYMTMEDWQIQKIETQDLIEFWVEKGLRQAEKDSSKPLDDKMLTISFLCEVWACFPSYIEQHEDLANSVLAVLKRACREKSRLLRLASYGKLFHLLSVFFETKNSYAPIIFKTLTFSLVENYSNERIREFLLTNFNAVLEEIPSIPISILLGPLIKQFQIGEIKKYNICDFEFFVAAARHGQLELKQGILLCDILGRIYLNDFCFSGAAEIPLMLIAARFKGMKAMQEFLEKLVELGFKLMCTHMSSKTIKSNMTSEELQEQKIFEFLKNLNFNISEKLIRLGNSELNSRLQDVLLQVNHQVKYATGRQLQGIHVVLGNLGDPSSLIEQFEQSQRALVPRNSSPKITRNKELSVLKDAKGLRSLSAMPKGRVLEDLEKARNTRLMKLKRDSSSSQQNSEKEKKQKKSLLKQLEKRKLVLGMEAHKGIPVVVNDSKNLVEMSLFNFYDETFEDQELLNIVMNKYKRVAKMLFNKYSSSGFKKKVFQKDTFDYYKDNKSVISEGEMVKLLRDQGVTHHYISTEEIKKVYNLLSQKYKSNMNYELLMPMFYQVAMIAYARPPKNLSNYPSAIQLKALFEQFYEKADKSGIPKYLFVEPDPGAGDREVVRTLNARLKQNPNMVLPEGYKRVREKEIRITYKVPEELSLKESYKASLELIDDIFSESIGVHILEGFVEVEEFTRTRGVLNKPQLDAGQKTIKYKSLPLPSYLKLTPGIKLRMTELAPSYPHDSLLEAAKVLDDLIYSADCQSLVVISRNPKPAGSVANRVVQAKQIEASNQQAAQLRSEMKRKQRRLELEKNLNSLKAEKEAKEKSEQEMKRREEEIKLKKQMKLKEKREKEKSEVEARVQEFHQKKLQEQAQKEQEERQLQEQEELKKKRNRELYLKEVQKLKESKKNQGDKKDQEYVSLKKVDYTPSEEAKIQATKFVKKKKKEAMRKELQLQQVKAAVRNNIIRDEVQQVFQTYSGGLQVLFNHYMKASAPALGSEVMETTGLNKFLTQFSVSPNLLTIEEAFRIFKSITKNKRETPVGLNIHEFGQALLSFSYLGQSQLEEKTQKKLEEPDELFKAFLEYLKLPKEAKKTLNLLKQITYNNSREKQTLWETPKQ